MTSDEEAKPPPAFPMPLGIEKIRVDFRTGRLSQNPERSLVVTVRGTNPRVRTEMISPDGATPEETGMMEMPDGAAPEETGLMKTPATKEPPGQADRASQGEQSAETGESIPEDSPGPVDR